MVVLPALAFCLAARPGTGAAAVPVRTDSVCFIVHNEGDPAASRVYGVRYFRDPPRPQTTVIILVHGNSVTHGFWDVRPDFSVARRLAQAGYLVIAYDRLGYGNSPCARPHGAGYSLTASSRRSMLHQIVGQVRAGDYALAGAEGCSASDRARVGMASPTVAENRAAITRVGKGLPVLLAWVDHDFFFPEGGETACWKAHCGCDVESWTQPDSGHALVAHRSMPAFTDKVVTWLASKGLVLEAVGRQ